MLTKPVQYDHCETSERLVASSSHYSTHRPKLLAVSLALLSLAQAVFLPWPRVLRSIKLWSTDEVLTS